MNKQQQQQQAVEGGKTSAPKSFSRRDHLRAIERRVQARWAQDRTHEVHFDPTNHREKYFLTFPYPYMNGRLHLGHAFSLTKAEFTARFQRLRGRNVLFPFGFHCTGMPIQAAANKLKEEIAMYGCPPAFPESDEAAASSQAPEEVVEEKSAEQAIAAKSKGKKTKLLVKGQTGTTRQWNILTKMVPVEEIPSFSDPMKWLSYFPPLGVSDLQAFGAAIDWRRSFITTSVNPAYDAFIRWQFNALLKGNRIRSGFRPNVYSAKDKQVCADHDRASGEGVGPQEYTIIKLLVIAPYPAGSVLNHCASLSGKSVYLAPATLRPETMYGQTNCYVLPEGEYGAYELKGGDVFIMSARAAVGLAHQDFAPGEWGQVTCHLVMTGQELLGLPLRAPNSVYECVYTLPLLTISMGKGTGVVTSVPSDAPDDYIALKELKDKPLWREKFGLTADMVEPFEVVPIIDIPGYGDKSAVVMCEKLDIKSSKDTQKLKQAKDEVYLKGFYEGVMLVGECAGMKVCDAKPIVRRSLIDRGDAIPYFEPESTVVGRSGDECVVALTDQWYLSYGDEQWRSTVARHVHSGDFNSYNSGVLESFDNAIDWLKEWACSREFGLGTRLPWDPKWVIDSLSDSTIYMAMYTIGHHFFGDVENLSGTSVSPRGISPEELTDEVFDFIFLRKPFPDGVSSSIPAQLLEEMRGEFEYWYPMDLRVSAKDLIPNHLTMSLYNHTEVWKDRPELWPRGIYCNGHVMVDAEKMSKSKGNFLMLLECVEEFSADATRFALADAGDSLEDANFDRSVANQAILYLHNEEEWIKLVLAGSITSGGGTHLRAAGSEKCFMDRVFDNEIDYLIEATFAEFDQLRYRDGIHRCWFDMIIMRDFYREWSTRCSVPMHESVVLRFIEALAVMMSPICPHWCENVWELLGKQSSVCVASWPAHVPFDRVLRKEWLFFRDFCKDIRQAITTSKVKLVPPKCAHIYLASTYEPLKVEVLQFMHTQCDASGRFEPTFVKELKSFLESFAQLKPQTKALMQFGTFMRDESHDRGIDALAVLLPFNQKGILEENSAYIRESLELSQVSFHDVEEAALGVVLPGDPRKISVAKPGHPSYCFYTGSP